MNIGEFAKCAGVSPSKVRFLERRGLLPSPARASNGYRRFGPAELERVFRIQRGQSLGFTLDQLAAFFSQPEPDRHDKAALIAAAEIKLSELDSYIAEAQVQRAQVAAFLTELRAEHAIRSGNSISLGRPKQQRSGSRSNTTSRL